MMAMCMIAVLLQISQGGSEWGDYESLRDTTRPQISFMHSAPDSLGFIYYWKEIEDPKLRDSLRKVNFSLMWSFGSGIGSTSQALREGRIPDSLVIDSVKALLRNYRSDSTLFLKEQSLARAMLINVYPELFTSSRADTLTDTRLPAGKIRILKYSSDLMLKNDHPDAQLASLIYRQLLRSYPCEEVLSRVEESIKDTENYLRRFMPEPVYVDGIQVPPPTDPVYVQKLRMQKWLAELVRLRKESGCR